MISVVSVSEVYLRAVPFIGNSRSSSSGLTGSGVEGASRAHCYDRDKQAWILEADLSGKYLAFRLFYTDISHVPRKFSRYVGWNIRLVSKGGSSRPKRTLDGPYCKYYVQQEADDGYVIRTDLLLDEVRAKVWNALGLGFLGNDAILFTVNPEGYPNKT